METSNDEFLDRTESVKNADETSEDFLSLLHAGPLSPVVTQRVSTPTERLRPPSRGHILTPLLTDSADVSLKNNRPAIDLEPNVVEGSTARSPVPKILLTSPTRTKSPDGRVALVPLSATDRVLSVEAAWPLDDHGTGSHTSRDSHLPSTRDTYLTLTPPLTPVGSRPVTTTKTDEVRSRTFYKPRSQSPFQHDLSAPVTCMTPLLRAALSSDERVKRVRSPPPRARKEEPLKDLIQEEDAPLNDFASSSVGYARESLADIRVGILADIRLPLRGLRKSVAPPTAFRAYPSELQH
eukprot:gene22309-26911_t